MFYCRKLFKGHQRGHVLPLTVILLALCSIMIASLLNFMGTGLTSASIQREKMNQVYAADAGIKQGIWKISNGAVPQTVDFSQTYPAFSENSENVVVRIDYQWILSGIAGAAFGPHNEWMDVTTTGNHDITGIYTIQFAYNLSGNPGNKLVEDMGVWLPFGYSYVAGSAAEFPGNMTLDEPSITRIHGGASLKWSEVNYSFKQTGLNPTQRFRFTPVGKLPKGDVAWVQSQSYEAGFADMFDSDSPEYVYDIEVNGHTVDLLVEWVDPATGQLPEGGPQAWRLEISKTADPAGGSPGQRLVITYDIVVHNAGTSVFHISEVGDWLPAGFEDVVYVAGSASGIISADPEISTVDGRLLLRWDLGESPGYRTEPGSTHHQIFQVEATMGWGTYMNYGWAVAKPNSIGFVSTGDAAPVASARLFDVSSTAGGTTIKARLGLAEDGRLGIVSWQKE